MKRATCVLAAVASLAFGCTAKSDACRTAHDARDDDTVLIACAAPFAAGDFAAGVALARAHYRRGDHGATLRIAEAITSGEHRSAALRLRGKVAEQRSRIDEARALFEAALQVDEAAARPRQIVLDALALGSLHHRQGDRRAALAHAAVAAASAEAAGDGRLRAYVHMLVGDVAESLGGLRAAEREFRAAARLASAPRDAAQARIRIGLLHRAQARPALATDEFERALVEAVEGNAPPTSLEPLG